MASPVTIEDKTNSYAVTVDASGSLQTSTGSPYVTAPSNLSSTITVGGAAQTAIGAAVAAKGWAVQNQSSDYLYVRQDGTAAAANQNSLRIAPGQLYVADFVTSSAVSIIGPTTGQAFWARAW